MLQALNEVLEKGNYTSYVFNQDSNMLESTKPIIDSAKLVEDLVGLVDALNATDIIYEMVNEYDIKIIQ
jgi:hypothetical protein